MFISILFLFGFGLINLFTLLLTAPCCLTCCLTSALLSLSSLTTPCCLTSASSALPTVVLPISSVVLSISSVVLSISSVVSVLSAFCCLVFSRLLSVSSVCCLSVCRVVCCRRVVSVCCLSQFLCFCVVDLCLLFPCLSAWRVLLACLGVQHAPQASAPQTQDSDQIAQICEFVAGPEVPRRSLFSAT